MWPFDGSLRPDVLRICRDAVELWTRTPSGLALDRRDALDRPMDLGALESAIVRLYEGRSSPQGSERIDAIVESAWLPVILLAPGPQRRRFAAVESLLMERLSELYDTAEDRVAQWQLRIEGLAGDTHVCGFGLRTRLRDSLTRALGVVGVVPASLQPAWSWGLAQESQRAVAKHSGWWFWQESDRTLLAGLRRGHVVSLHPALAPMHDDFDARAVAALEAGRTGADASALILVGGWLAPRSIAETGTWSGVTSPAAAKQHR